MSLRKWLARWRGLRRERAALSREPGLDFPLHNLRRASPRDLVALLRGPAYEEEWSALQEHVWRIPDGATGGVNPGDRRAIYHLVRSLDPHSVLEIGTHVGASTLAIASALRDNSVHGTKGYRTLVTVDIEDVNDPELGAWRRMGAAGSAADGLEAIGCRAMVTFVTAGSLDFLKSTSQLFQLIFLDGDHRAVAVYREISLALRRLAPGGLILLHDVFPGGRPLWPDGAIVPGPTVAIDRIRRQQPDFHVVPLGELPWPTKLGSNVTSLAITASA